MNTVIIDGLSFALPLFIMAIGGIYSEKAALPTLPLRACRASALLPARSSRCLLRINLREIQRFPSTSPCCLP